MIFKRRSPRLREIVLTTLDMRKKIPARERPALAERLAREFQPLADAGLEEEVIDSLRAAIEAAEREAA